MAHGPSPPEAEDARLAQSPRLLITRPPDDAVRLLAALRARGIVTEDAIVSPLVAIEMVDGVAAFPPHVSGVVLTSAHALGAGPVRALPRGLAAYCVGERTTVAARAMGFDAKSAAGDADDLVRLVRGSGAVGPLVHPHGAHTRGDVAGRLTAAGIPCTGVVVYAQNARAPTAAARAALDGPGPLIVPLFSPRTAHLLSEAAPFAAPLHVVAMSAAVADAGSALDARSVDIAEQPTQEAVVDHIVDVWRRLAHGQSPLRR